MIPTNRSSFNRKMKRILQFALLPALCLCCELFTIYDTMGGRYWYNKYGWDDPTSDCCSMYGVTCVNGKIVKIQMIGNNITGNLPENLFSFSTLNSLLYLSLKGNDIRGNIPLSLCNATSIVQIDLSRNDITGKIPSCLWKLQNLTLLSLYMLKLTGNIPQSLCSIPGLSTLWLDENKLTGEVPSCLTTMNLTDLYLSNNNITGRIPEVTGHIKRLYLDGNRLTGDVPLSICGNNVLREFSVKGNSLTGTFPHRNCSLSGLEFMDLGMNKFTGIELSTNMQLLRYLSASHCNIQYVYWQGFLSLGVSFVDLSNNNIQVFPGDVFHFSISYLDLSDNPMYGTINNGGNCMQYMNIHSHYLQTLNLDNTNVKFYGTGMCRYAYLSYLFLSGTKFTNNDLVEISTAFNNLRLLDVSYTNASGDLQKLAENLQFLDILDVTNTKVSTDFPTVVSDKSYILDSGLKDYYNTYSCIRLKTKSGAIVRSDPDFVNYQTCACNANYFGKPPNCKPCLKNTVCSGSSTQGIKDFYLGSGNINPINGYWLYPQVDPVISVKCPVSRLCSSENTCIQGYTGRFCTKCNDDYFEFGSGFSCAKCPSTTIVIIYIVITVLLLFGIVFLSFVLGAASSGCIKIVIFFMQAIGKIQYNSDRNTQVLVSTMNFLNELNVVGISCKIDWSFKNKYITFSILPVEIFILIFSIYFIGRLFTDKAVWKKKCKRSLIFLLYLVYFPVMTTLVTPLSCDGEGITSIPYEDCDSSYIAPSVILILLYGFSLPLIPVIQYIKHPYESGTFDILYSSYKEEKKYWELILSLRKILFIILMQTFVVGSTVQLLLVLVLIQCSLLLQLFNNPFKQWFENLLECISAILISITAAYTSKVEAEGESLIYTFLLHAINIIFALFIFAVIARNIIRKLKLRAEANREKRMLQVYPLLATLRMREK